MCNFWSLTASVPISFYIMEQCILNILLNVYFKRIMHVLNYMRVSNRIAISEFCFANANANTPLLCQFHLKHIIIIIIIWVKSSCFTTQGPNCLLHMHSREFGYLIHPFFCQLRYHSSDPQHAIMLTETHQCQESKHFLMLKVAQLKKLFTWELFTIMFVCFP